MKKILNLFLAICYFLILAGCQTTDSLTRSLGNISSTVKEAVLGESPKEPKDSDPIELMNPPQDELALFKKYGIKTVGDFKKIVLEMKESGYLKLVDNPGTYQAAFVYLKDREAARKTPGISAIDVIKKRKDESKRQSELKKKSIFEVAPKNDWSLVNFCSGVLIEAHGVMKDESPKMMLNKVDRIAINEFIKHLDTNSQHFILATALGSSVEQGNDKDDGYKQTQEGLKFAKLRIGSDPWLLIKPNPVKEDVKFCLDQWVKANKYIGLFKSKR